MNPTTLLDCLADELRKAGRYNRNDQTAPAAVLWTDAARRFEVLIPHLRNVLPVLSLGQYQPNQLTGPAIWIRCVIAQTLPEIALLDGVPVIYLPGIDKSQLRAVQECPDFLKPLAELQYRGVLFIHDNGKDWTPGALLNQQGVKVATNQATQDALQRALGRLALEPIAELRKHLVLTAEIINGLLTPDLVGLLLDWIAQPEISQAQMKQEGTWDAFVEGCRHHYGLNPAKEGPLSAARKLGDQQDKWDVVWNRFVLAPQRYAGVEEQLRLATPSGLLKLHPESWPQDNQEGETRLRQELLMLKTLPAPEARRKLQDLEALHGKRRGWVWAKLHKAPLAMALESLASLAKSTTSPLGAGLPHEIAQRYFEEQWKTDAWAMEALARAKTTADLEAVKAALIAVYRPWLDAAARAFQDAVLAQPLPFPNTALPEAGTCLVFTDGLRLDVAQRLADLLSGHGFEVVRDWTFGALPGITPTAKPAISPIANQLRPAEDFEVSLRGSRVNASVLRKGLEEAGVCVILEGQIGDPSKGGWTEYGDLDSTGHAHGLKLARQIGELIQELAERIIELLQGGWSEVRLITDHGWLLVPGGLPKVELAQHLTEKRKGRTARLKPGSNVSVQTVPWRFDSQVNMAMAKGIAAFEEGKEYEHGGLSVQECVLPLLKVRQTVQRAQPIRIKQLRWKGLRCEIAVEGGSGAEQMELRIDAADSTSRVAGPKPVGQSLLVPDDSLEGQKAYIVALAPDGKVLSQLQTLIGGE